MKRLKDKIIIILVLALFFIFFNNSFGVVDIEKMAIITAIGIDMQEDKYEVTAQIAVPEEDSTHTEKKKTHIQGRGVTVGDAIKDISDISGWYPQLVFCNLIVLGKDFMDKNVLTILDYFAKTLRIQDSALVVLSTEKAKDLLSKSSPLDNISSFALQKVLYKQSGFNKDVAEMNIKEFCAEYYSPASSSFMPIISTLSVESSTNEQEGSGQKNIGGIKQNASNSSSDSGGNNLFSAKKTALFKNGIMVGELNEELTIMYNLLTNNYTNSVIAVENVDEYGSEKTNYMLNVLKNTTKLNLVADNEGVTLNVKLNLYCKVGDQNSKSSHTSLSRNDPLPTSVKETLENKLYNDMYSYFQVLKQSNCDMLKLEHKLFRFNYPFYATYKDNLLEKLKLNLSVNVTGNK